jgi:hypothetical protein
MSGTTANLNGTPVNVQTEFDSIVIVANLEGIPGGKTLDVSGYTPTGQINAGHLIIEETATGVLKPLNVTTGAYVSLPASHTYKGVLVSSILKEKPFAAIMVRGSVNEVAFVNGGGFATPAGAKTALTLIRFTQD